MKKSIFVGIFSLISATLCALPYYSERSEGTTLYVFHGNIEEEAMPIVRKLEAQFMEHQKKRWHYQRELQKMGVDVQEVENDEHKKSQLPLDVRNHGLPEGVT